MQSRLNPYISFQGTAREALAFYNTVFGGTLTLTTFGEGGMAQDPNDSEKIMHGMIVADNGMALMAADTPVGMPHQPGTTISLSLSGDNEAELTGYWEKLTEGGTIREPLAKAPWGDTFGMLTDKFGIEWMVNIAGQAAAETAASDSPAL